MKGAVESAFALFAGIDSFQKLHGLQKIQELHLLKRQKYMIPYTSWVRERRINRSVCISSSLQMEGT